MAALSAIGTLSELDILLPLMRPVEDVSIEERSALEDAIAAARAALPISATESRWFYSGHFDFDMEVIGMSLEVYARHLLDRKHREGELISHGMRVPVSTRELSSRWLEWIQQEGRFAGQGTLDMAREALRTAMMIIEPSRRPPESYLKLRGRHDEPGRA